MCMEHIFERDALLQIATGQLRGETTKKLLMPVGCSGAAALPHERGHETKTADQPYVRCSALWAGAASSRGAVGLIFRPPHCRYVSHDVIILSVMPPLAFSHSQHGDHAKRAKSMPTSSPRAARANERVIDPSSRSQIQCSRPPTLLTKTSCWFSERS